MTSGSRRFCLFFIVSLFVPFTVFAAEPKTLRVGAVLPLTGVASLPGLHLKNGLMLAIEELAASGQKVDLLIEDSKTDSKSSVSAYQKLASIAKVDAVVGDIWDFLVSPLIPLSKQSKTPTISPTVMDFVGSELAGSEYFWSLGSRVVSLEPATIKFLEVNSGKTKTGIFCWNNFWGEAHLQEWRRVLAKSGRTIVSEQCESDFSSDLRAVSLKIQATKPELIFVSTLIGTFAKRLSELQSKVPVLSTADMLEELENTGFDKSLVEDWYFTQWKDPEDFAKKYEKKFGMPPIHEASKSYYALLALAEAWREKKSDETLTDSLRRVKLTKSDGGHIDFSKQPFANETVASLYQVKSGKAIEVYTPK